MSQRFFSKEGFQPLSNTMPPSMANPNDATIDIPLTPVKSRIGARKPTNTVSTTYAPVDSADSDIQEKPRPFSRGLGGRRRRIQVKGREKKDDEDGAITAMGKIYTTILTFSVITRYFVYVLPLALAIAVPIVVGATVAKSASIGGVRIVWFFTWVEVVWLSLWVSKLVSQFLPYLFQFLVGIVSAGTRKYSLVLTALEIPLSLVGWALTALTTFVPLMTLNPTQRAHKDTGLKEWESVVKNILFASLFSTLILLAEKLIVQLISISYHRMQFDEKIKASKHNIYLLSLLYDASRTLFPAYSQEFAGEDYVINDPFELGGISKPSSSHGRSGSNTPMRIIQNVGMFGDKLTAAVGTVAQEITGKQVFNVNSAHSIVVQALEKKRSSEALARRIWMSFVMEGKEALYEEDIVEVLGPSLKDEAAECFQCLDTDGNGDVSLDEMVLTVKEFGRERKSIANSMHDVDQAIGILDNLLVTVTFIMSIFVYVAFLNKSFTTTLATAGTALLSLSFVFAATAQEVLGSCIFLFVKHPFDVGDRVDISDVQLVVERISLLFTVFRKVRDHKTTQVPNILLNSLWIDNISRSKAMREQVFLYVNADTSLEDVQLLRNEMASFVQKFQRDFQPDFEVELTGLAEMNKLELKVEIRHKSNWANEAVRAARRSKFMCALVLALRKVPIYGPAAGGAPAGDPANPTYSVAISPEAAETNKKVFEENKEKKRMIPVVTPQIFKTTSPIITRSTGFDSFPGTTTSRKIKAPTEPLIVEPLNTGDATHDPAGNKGDNIYRPAEYVDELAKSETKRSNDLEGVRNILSRESTTGRRKARLPPISSQSPISRVPTEPTPITRQGPKVGFDEETTEYHPLPEIQSSTSSTPPRGGSPSRGNSNPYVSPLRIGANPYQPPPPLSTSLPATTRRPVQQGSPPPPSTFPRGAE